ncbi:MAG: hypothetical protein HFI22_10535 [Lachnospiraceae bacterium]|jgi:hypothetical protein|nr:hypothetical protein [Lachnospiraceae bacterium]
MENDKYIHIETTYKKKKVKVQLRFSEGTNDKDTQYFYDNLKKIYIGKKELGAMRPNISALKYNK